VPLIRPIAVLKRDMLPPKTVALNSALSAKQC
jgi:hypothetical protein